MDATVSVVIAAHNEAARIEESVRAAAGLPGVVEVIVADDGSRDATAALAERAGALTLRLPHRGKGQAVAAGVERARGSVVLLADADLGDAIGSFATLLEPVRAGRADMTIGSFQQASGGGGFGLVMALARWGARRWGGVSLAAPLSGQRAARAELLKSLALEPGFGLEVGLDIDVPRRGGRILEVALPVAAPHAVTGKSVRGFLHRGHQFRAVAAVLARRALGWSRR